MKATPDHSQQEEGISLASMFLARSQALEDFVFIVSSHWL